MLTDLLSSQDIFSTPDLKTKMSILHAVDRSLDRMTISEICKKASISRQTFYRHFRSKYDIPWWFCIFCRQFYLNEIGRTISWQTGYYHHIRLLSTEREFFFSTASIRLLARRLCRKIGKQCCLRRLKFIGMCRLTIICCS